MLRPGEYDQEKMGAYQLGGDIRHSAVRDYTSNVALLLEIEDAAQ